MDPGPWIRQYIYEVLCRFRRSYLKNESSSWTEFLDLSILVVQWHVIQQGQGIRRRGMSVLSFPTHTPSFLTKKGSGSGRSTAKIWACGRGGSIVAHKVMPHRGKDERRSEADRGLRENGGLWTETGERETPRPICLCLQEDSDNAQGTGGAANFEFCTSINRLVQNLMDKSKESSQIFYTSTAGCPKNSTAVSAGKITIWTFINSDFFECHHHRIAVSWGSCLASLWISIIPRIQEKTVLGVCRKKPILIHACTQRRSSWANFQFSIKITYQMKKESI